MLLYNPKYSWCGVGGFDCEGDIFASELGLYIPIFIQ